MKRIIFLDIMQSDQFYTQLKYAYDALMPFDMREAKEFILKRFPWLRREQFTVELSNQRV